MTLRVAALVKQIPAFETMTLGADGRLVREGLELEMSAYCRRAVAQAVALVADHGGTVTVITLGPPSAEDVLREAIAWAADRDVEGRGVLVSDPAFAGSDTLATARALAATFERLGGFDLVLAGRNSVDADTGQVGPELAELLGLPFVTGARHLTLTGGTLDVRAEHDDGWAQVQVDLPAVVSTAERLIDPCKVDPAGRAAVPADRITVVHAAELGPGPWGAAASPTTVGATRLVESSRLGRHDADLPLPEQIARAVAVLHERGALDARHDRDADRGSVPASIDGARHRVGVVVEPQRAGLTRELLGAAAGLDAEVVALSSDGIDLEDLGGWGADHVVAFTGIAVGQRGGHRGRGRPSGRAPPRPGRSWRRAPRGVARSRPVPRRRSAPGSPAMPSSSTCRPTSSSRGSPPSAAGSSRRSTAPPDRRWPRCAPACSRPGSPAATLPTESVVRTTPRSRLHLRGRTRDDDLDLLADAPVVIGVGQGVDPSDYPLLDPLAAALGAELAATRKVTDQGWLPRARQIGITGRTIAPRLFVSIGASGKFNHMVGVRTAGTILAVNRDPEALIVDAADVTIVGDYREVVPLLATALAHA